MTPPSTPQIAPVQDPAEGGVQGRVPVADSRTLELLRALERKILWLSSWTIHNANHLRESRDGLKVGGHQASCASLVTLMTALYFEVLQPEDRVAVKPHASPVFHAIQYLLGSASAPSAAPSPTPRAPRTATTWTSRPGRSAWAWP